MKTRLATAPAVLLIASAARAQTAVTIPAAKTSGDTVQAEKARGTT